MAITEWQHGEKSLTGSESHWFGVDLNSDNGGVIVVVPYTTDYGQGTPPWTVTLTTLMINGSGEVTGTPIAVATYQTGFNFQTSTVDLTNGNAAVFWTSADGTFPQSSAVDLNVRTVNKSGKPVGASTTLLSGIDDLYQFHVTSAALGGTGYDLAYSTYDTSTGIETETVQAFAADGTPQGAATTLDRFKTGHYDPFAFGTLTPSTGADPGFITLREIDAGFEQELGYKLVGTDNSVSGAYHHIVPAYTEGSTNHQIIDWTWDRLDPPAAGGYDLVTAALVSDKSHGEKETEVDVRLTNTGTGRSVDDVTNLVGDNDVLALATLSNGGFVVAYDNEFEQLSLVAYTNQGDITGRENIGYGFRNVRLSILPQNHIAAAYSKDGGQSLSYDIFDVSGGPTQYFARKGMTRRNIELGESDGLVVFSGGTAIDTNVDTLSEGVVVETGGRAIRTRIDGGRESVEDGAISTDTVILSGSQDVERGGTAVGTVIRSGDQDTMGVTQYTVIEAGSFQFVGQRAYDSNADVKASGNQWVEGGTVIRAEIDGGEQLISRGSVKSTTVNGGDQDISGGTVTGTVLNSGDQTVERGARASLTTLHSGGTLIVKGTANGVNDGGLVQLDSGTLGTSGSVGLVMHRGKLTSSGTSTIAADVTTAGQGRGSAEVTGGTLAITGKVAATLDFTVDASTTLTLDQSVAAGATVAFAGDKAALLLNDAPQFHGTVAGFVAGDTIDLGGFAAAGAIVRYAADADGSGGVLTVKSGSKKAMIALDGAFVASGFAVASDKSGGGTALTYAPPQQTAATHLAAAQT